jgi:signal transduction histidine kinase
VRARDEVFARGEPVLPQSFAESMRYDAEGAGERHFLVRAAPLRREPGETPFHSINAIVVAQDVTRLRRIDELKSDVVATVSHELKTPLTSLRLATYMLLEGAGPLTEGQRELATTARGDVERLRSIVDELLDLVRIEREAGALRRSRIAVATLFEDVVDGHRAIAANKGIVLGVSPLDPARRLDVDAEKLSVVLSNLVANAIRHTPAGGRVELSVEGREDDPEVSLIVKDTGEGIASEELLHVFDRHYRGGDVKTKRGDRHGLGLSIAREIVEHHGGRIEVKSRRGEGSAFAVVLPNVALSPTSERPPMSA